MDAASDYQCESGSILMAKLDQDKSKIRTSSWYFYYWATHDADDEMMNGVVVVVGTPR